MGSDQKRIEDILIKGVAHVLRRTLEVNAVDQLAIAPRVSGMDKLHSS